MDVLILEGKLEVLKNLLRKGIITPKQFSSAVVKLKGTATAVKDISLNKTFKYQPLMMRQLTDPTIATTFQSLQHFIR